MTDCIVCPFYEIGFCCNEFLTNDPVDCSKDIAQSKSLKGILRGIASERQRSLFFQRRSLLLRLDIFSKVYSMTTHSLFDENWDSCPICKTKSKEGLIFIRKTEIEKQLSKVNKELMESLGYTVKNNEE